MAERQGINISVNRRFVIRGVLIAGAAGMLPFPLRAQTALRQVETPSHMAFLKRALDLASIAEARGEGTPYGAVIVRNGEIIGEGWNRMYLKKDATAHAEIEAVQDACERLETRDLSGTLMYTNGGRPCPMCETVPTGQISTEFFTACGHPTPWITARPDMVAVRRRTVRSRRR